MKPGRSGFLEVEHTADWELLVWAPDLPTLFSQAAQGMYQLTGTRLEKANRKMRSLDLDAGDIESLLVYFLTELLYWGEHEGLGFDEFALKIDGLRLSGQVKGAAIISQDKEIKAVTFHNLQVRSTSQGLEVNVVFDV